MSSSSPSRPGMGQVHPHADRNPTLEPDDVVEILTLQPGMAVAEFGAAHGRFTLPVSEAVGDAGHVFALESSPHHLAVLRDRLRGRRNIHLVEAQPHATPLAAGSCDRALMPGLWAELPDPIAALREAARLLRENGLLILIEWHAHVQNASAPPPQARMSLEQCVNMLENNGWNIHRHGSIGPDHYYLLASVSDESVQS